MKVFAHATNIKRTKHTKRTRGGFLVSSLLALMGLVLTLCVVAGLLLAYVYIVINPKLPSLESITDYRPKIPLRIYSSDQVLLGEFGVERRSLVRLQEIPAHMKNALLVTEDANFYKHGGIDVMSIVRATLSNVMTRGAVGGGASTITQQVARNFFLSSNEPSFIEKASRKFLYEIPLAWKIEREMTKDQILEVYMNQIYLGQRAFGFAAAAQTYFGQDIQHISIAQAAMLAGLPKAPSAYNPVVNPKRARIRQQYILKRLVDLHYITQAEYEAARDEPLTIKGKRDALPAHAEYISEIVRQMMVDQFKEDAYTRGLNVVTTIKAQEQEAAYAAVRKGVIAYDHRYVYRGPDAFIPQLPATGEERDQRIFEALQAYSDNGDIVPAVVIRASPTSVTAVLRTDTEVTITGDGLKFVANYLTDNVRSHKRIKPGAIIRVAPMNKTDQWHITQLPQVEASLIALSPQDGAIRALVGGFDFNQNNFNHATQAWRQPGSAFKPFIYAAALEKGLGPATMVNDAPASYPAGPGQPNWEPKNDDNQFIGPASLRTGLQRSRNLMTVRVLDAIGVGYAQDFISTHFGFDRKNIPLYLPMALGAGTTTPLQLANAYAVFANGGYRVNPYLIKEVKDSAGHLLSQATPLVVGQNAPRSLDARNSYIMTSLLQSAAQRGTGSASNALQRTDLAGKTGTTNEAIDGWFAGYQKTVVAVAWMGYDQPRSLGGREFGSRLALPMWMAYMAHALKDVPNMPLDPPPPDITMIDGEMYFDNFTPGHGFVTNVGLPDASVQRAREKPYILDLFSGR